MSITDPDGFRDSGVRAVVRRPNICGLQSGNHPYVVSTVRAN